jgi:molybdenum cofactor synthesis domain-containing protein
MEARNMSMLAARVPKFGLIVVGDEILSGKRQDKHMDHLIGLLQARGLALSYAHYVGDEPDLITQQLRSAFESGDVVFSTGGIGATPDDHTRQCAAKALGVELEMHPQARDLIIERIRDMAAQQGKPFDPAQANDPHRLNMAVFPQGAQIIPNPYNKIAGFTCRGLNHGAVHFVPGFPVMAGPMMEWVLDAHYNHWFGSVTQVERSVVLQGAMEATLTPLMQLIEAQHPQVRIFSLPSVDHPQHGRHVELGVKGAAQAVTEAYAALLQGLTDMGLRWTAELQRQ